LKDPHSAIGRAIGNRVAPVGSGNRITFSTGEQRLSDWLAENARVVWMVCDQPWRVEEELIASMNLPINLGQNRNHAFHQVLSELRQTAKAKAKILPILPR
jgi:hypothetical protein